MVSVIIPTFNSSFWIREALQSIVSQGPRHEFDVIVVDDSRSTDDLGGIIRREFDFVQFMRVASPGPSAARNAGTRLARGELIQYLDADDILAVGKVGRQKTLLEETGADVAYGDWQELAPAGSGFALGKVTERILEDPDLDLLNGEFWCPTAAYLFRRRIVEKIGGWNEALIHFDDDRFIHDCAIHGAAFVYCHGIMAYHRTYPKSLVRKNRVEVLRNYHRNAREAYGLWVKNGGITEPRRRALARCLGSITKSSVEADKQTFEAALADLEQLCPDFVPDGPPRLRIATRIFGYRRAHQLASLYRAAKQRALGR